MDTHTLAFDTYDRRLLEALQANARLSNVALAERVHLSPSQCQRRLKRLESAGVIRGYATMLDRRRLGLGVMAFVNVSLEKHGTDPARAFAGGIGEFPQVLECWAVSGDSDYLLRVVSPDLERFSEFLLHELLGLPMVASVRSNILLQRLKETTALPLDQLG
ncbi:Lrp/AsnC family transcriptional regulator [Arhodomonas aquaeolei]|uniref:Lrp/AsnC family transcriptional regulator n=1 Tax=Arhodomonas aquaeolei TaxID=2369 RepID=UPI00036993B6|nr:Lrp/AsnC family transcriptional regulator [Arhodomonas aquaeolei]